ncbi:DUF2274 domain-containing protein [Bradyrhizobium stylosanthis]|uniref:DUF2274 domain-containing protein n=1 Tax=Bradyrhizobium stylosanthis TaxID=1803665 RepID=A0A560E2T3_9BRAD|nr:DUF2274 domain-containing protein [Bradyrhizobium stylosanthis]TWB03691.1 hypothetical protein FBZ96_102164 [Bradyrhizobium stylosanthis]
MKLGKLPDRAPVKMSIVLTPRLAQRLKEYGDFYAETYGNKEEVAELIPFMLEALLDSDSSFKRSRSSKGARALLGGSREKE